MNRLSNRMKNQSNITRTENNAKTYRSTTNAVLDFFYLAPTRQGQDNTALFRAAYEENPNLALKAALYLRDVRGGKGQRKTFRDILNWLANNERTVFNTLVPYVPEYGRWDDILLFGGYQSVQNLVEDQLAKDLHSEGSVSLLGKWMPSENATSNDTKNLGIAWAKTLGLSLRDYRKMLSALRSKIGVVEKDMSARDWEGINYSYVPSRAMKLYRKAFERHDEDRFHAFIEKAVKGEVKIQSRTLYPHEIVSEILHGNSDKALEAMWNQLPDYFDGEQRNLLVVVDTSSSMEQSVALKSKVQAIDVSVALGIYCAERNVGAFQNVIMTFNSRPDTVILTGKSITSKVAQAKSIPWGGSTNLQGTFEELLRYAREEEVPAEDMPTNIVIITDGEFNRQIQDKTNFEGIQDQYARAGYAMPLVTFWNVMARNNQVPVTKDERNVFLVSGFSAETIGKVLNGEKLEERTPMELMLQVLNSERYHIVDELGL